LSPLEQAPSDGEPSKFKKLKWSNFVHCILQLTIKAYEAMNQDRVAERDWEENVFTVCLAEDYLRPLAFDHEYSIRVDVRSKTHTKEMKQGDQATIEAKEMDLSMYGVWERDYIKRRFVWEAKRVGDKRVDEKYGNLNSEYIHEAIYRFIRREYADGLGDAGILGYVLAGSVSNIVGDINQSMGNITKNSPLDESNHLEEVDPIDEFEDVYRSFHKRTDDTRIRLHHLFLTFEFS